MERLLIVAVGAAVFWAVFGFIQGALSEAIKSRQGLKGCIGCFSFLVVAAGVIGIFAFVSFNAGPSDAELARMSDMDVRLKLLGEAMKVSRGEITQKEFFDSPYKNEFDRRGLNDK